MSLHTNPTPTVSLLPSPTLSLLPLPHHINDEHKVYSIAVAIAIMAGVTLITVLWRLYYRVKMKAFGFDDYAMIAALLLYLLWSVMGVYMNLRAGVGKPLWEITMREYSTWFKGIIASMWVYPVMSTAIRVSILLFYRRIFAITPTSTSRHRCNTWYGTIKGLLFIQFIYLFVFMLLPIFVCDPLDKAWDDPENRKLYMDDFYYFRSQTALYMTSMVLDVVLLFLPVWPIMKLQMPMSRRVAALCLLVMGSGASLAAALKVALFVTEMERYNNPASAGAEWVKYDMSSKVPPQFDNYGLTFWIPSQIEPTIALLGASIPGIRQGLSRTLKAYFNNKKKKKNKTTHDKLVDLEKDGILLERVSANNSDLSRRESRAAPDPVDGDGNAPGTIKLTFERLQTVHTACCSESPVVTLPEEGEGLGDDVVSSFRGPYGPFAGPATCTMRVSISASPKEKTR